MLSPFLRAFYYSNTSLAHLLALCSMAMRKAVAIPTSTEFTANSSCRNGQRREGSQVPRFHFSQVPQRAQSSWPWQLGFGSRIQGLATRISGGVGEWGAMDWIQRLARFLPLCTYSSLLLNSSWTFPVRYSSLLLNSS
jgi:hypothetical protein